MTLRMLIALDPQSRHVSGRIFKRRFEIESACLQNGYQQPHDSVIQNSAGWYSGLQNFLQAQGSSRS